MSGHQVFAVKTQSAILLSGQLQRLSDTIQSKTKDTYLHQSIYIHVYNRLKQVTTMLYNLRLLLLACLTSWLNFRNILMTMAVIFLHANSRQFSFDGH